MSMINETFRLELSAAPPSNEEAMKALLILFRCLTSRHPVVATAEATPSRAPWMTLADAAAYASVSEDTLREWISSGKLHAGRQGRVIRVRHTDIDALLTGQGAERQAGEEGSEAGKASEETSERARGILTTFGRKAIGRD